jgi:hypothetical protein
MIIDQEFYDVLDRFIENLVANMPTSYEAAINALEAKAANLRKKLKSDAR